MHVPLAIGAGVVRRKLGSLARPFSEVARCAEFGELLRQRLSRGYDVLHVEHIFSAWATLGAPRQVVYIDHLDDVDWRDRQGLGLSERVMRLQMNRATAALISRIENVLVASPRIAKELLARKRDMTMLVVPLGLDTALYTPPALPSKPVLGLIGSMHWYPSRSAAERLLTRIWPKVHDRVPEAELLVGGWNSENYLSHLFPVPGARLIGEVKDPAEFYRQISAVAYPLPNGTGMKIKVLESFAYGRTVVSNAEGFEGLDPVDGVHALWAETDEDFAAQAATLLRDPAACRRLGTNGRKLLEERYSPTPTIDRLISAYERFGLKPKPA
jgi:glycosyltransferase involved in cell wall biosynthesis